MPKAVQNDIFLPILQYLNVCQTRTCLYWGSSTHPVRTITGFAGFNHVKLYVPEGLINLDQIEGSGRDGDVDGETRFAGCCLFGCGKILDLIVTFSCSQLHFQKQIAGTKRYHVDELHVKTRSHTLVQMMCVWYIYLYTFILPNYCTKIQLNIWKFPKNSGFSSQIIHFDRVFYYKLSILGVFPPF